VVRTWTSSTTHRNASPDDFAGTMATFYAAVLLLLIFALVVV
jgi:hypothetical protein